MFQKEFEKNFLEDKEFTKEWLSMHINDNTQFCDLAKKLLQENY